MVMNGVKLGPPRVPKRSGTPVPQKDPNEPFLIPMDLLSQFTRPNGEICFLCARKMKCLKHNPSGGPLKFAIRRGQKAEDVIDKLLVRGEEGERG